MGRRLHTQALAAVRTGSNRSCRSAHRQDSPRSRNVPGGQGNQWPWDPCRKIVLEMACSAISHGMHVRITCCAAPDVAASAWSTRRGGLAHRCPVHSRGVTCTPCVHWVRGQDNGCTSVTRGCALATRCVCPGRGGLGRRPSDGPLRGTALGGTTRSIVGTRCNAESCVGEQGEGGCGQDQVWQGVRDVGVPLGSDDGDLCTEEVQDQADGGGAA